MNYAYRETLFNILEQAMTIFRKDALQREREQLRLYFQQLNETLCGRAPTANIAERYHQNPEDFSREYTDINLEQLENDIAHFKVTVEALKKIKNKAAPMVHRG